MSVSCFRGLLTALFVLSGTISAVWAGTPDAVNDTVTVRKDTKTDIDVIANDIGSSFGPGVINVTTAPTNGTAKIVAGKVQYIPNAGFTGTDTFTYTVRNGLKFGKVQRSPVRFVTSAENGGSGAVSVQASGWGSAMAPGPNANEFYLLTDRGPNADGTSDTNKTFPVPDFNPKLGLFQRTTDGSFALKQTINLKRPDGTLITGLPNPVNTSGLETASLVGGGAVTLTPPGSAQGQDTFGLDPEGLAFVSDGFWVSDEYGPQIVKFDFDGIEQERLNPFSFNAQTRKLPRILGERRPNRGMEGLCVTPGGKLVGIMQSALKLNNAETGQAISNGNNNKTPVLRILRYDPATGNSELFVYLLDNTANTNQMRVSEITAINEDKFLVLERDDAPPVADPDGTSNNGGPYKVIYEIDLTKSLDATGAVINTPPTDVNGGRNQTTGALIPYVPGDVDADPDTAPAKVKQWKRASDNAINTLEVLCQQQNKAQSLVILLNLQNPVTNAAEPVRPVAKTAFYDYFNGLGTAYPHTKTEGIVILERNMAGDAATKIALVNDDDFGIDVLSGAANTITTNINANGVQTFNEIVEIDIAAATTDTATVNITVEEQTPFITPVAPSVVVKPIFTVGDSVNAKLDGVTSYRMVGIPDGLGAFDNGDGSFTLSIAHELGSGAGIVREHGSKGALVSVWNINKSTLKVNSIKDHNPSPTSIFTTTNGNGTIAGTANYGRFCSADLPAVTAFFNVGSGKGTSNRIFMGGEENGAEGRAFAHVLTGPSAGFSYELPHLGKFSWENAVACPQAQDKTIVIGTDDSSPGQVYMYVGTKDNTGTEVQKAGLVGGTLYGVRANSIALEDRTTAVGAAKDVAVPFTLVNLGDASTKTGAQLQTDSVMGGVTEFLRPEDGAWDPNNPADFYFVTTDRFDELKNIPSGSTVGRSRLWRLRFSNIATPENGGTITLLIDGSENPGPNMMDNLCVDLQGRVVITEDIGGKTPSGKIWSYSIANKTLTLVAKHNPALFGDLTEAGVVPPASGFSNDEEASGIIDAADILGTGWYLLDVQAHVTANDTELAEKGQLLALFIPASIDPANPTASAPYLVPVADGVQAKAIFTVGESANPKPNSLTPYRMVGIPDGLGAFDNGDGSFTLTIGHELGTTAGIARAHGNVGAFVSVWNINKSTFQVNSIKDHNANNTSIFTGGGTVAGTTTYSRFCSADLPEVTAFFNSTTGKGTTSRIFMNGEESGDEGRAFAHIITGASAGFSYELPHLGKFSWENSMACPKAQDKTIVAGTDDSTPGQVYMYIGEKRTTGNEVEKAGLVGGKLFGVRANGIATEDRTTAVGGAKDTPVPFTLVDLGDVSTKTGAQLQASSVTAGVTQFLRPEDGAWDPNNPADFYFVTTDRFDQIKNVSTGTQIGRSRLWLLRFSDIAQPELGGTITMLIDGSENPGPNMMDNLCVDKFGRVIITEDIGGQAPAGKIWSYSISSGKLTLVAKHDPAIFGDVTESSVTAASSGFSNDEEASGIIDASAILGTGWYLVDVQAHGTTVETELVEKGQLLALFIPTAVDETTPSTAPPYLVPVASGVQTKAVFTVGDSVNLKPNSLTPYRMVGIPDGLGAFDNNDGTFTLTIGHELGSTAGTFRAHGSKGAFVSVWNIDKDTLQVNSIKDHNPNNTSIFTSTNGNGTIAGTALYSRFCSADLPVPTAFFNPATGNGTSARIFMNGEETGNEGRAFAHVITGAAAGNSYELPRLGKFSWENSIACPLAQDTTIVVGTDDSTPGQVYVYVGTKGNSGNDVAKAGLTNGILYGIRANSVAVEDRTTGIGSAKNADVPFTMVNLGDVSSKTGAQLQADSTAGGVTEFLRPEDGAWDPNNPTDFYFVTTDRFDQVKNGGIGTQVGRSRLWRLRFTSLSSPQNGGNIRLLIDGSEDPGPNMMDNLCVDKFGRVMITEDPGGQAHSARVWMYTIATGALTEVAKHDPKLFGDLVDGTVIAPTAPFSNDEESSGIIDAASLLGDGWYLLDVQAHVSNPDTELVERGQLLAMFVPTTLPPAISPIPNQVTNEDTATGAIGFTVTAGSFAITSVTAVSSNKTLLPDASAVVAGTGENRTITLTPAANQNGVTTVTVTVTDGGGQTATTSFTLTVQPVADLPTVTSQPTATPNPAKKGQTVTFAVAATGANSIEWNFGDGTPVGTTATVTHAYTAAGIFTATVKLTGTDGSSTFTVNVVVEDTTAPDGDFDGDGIANTLDPDDDNDGYSDSVEAAMGSDSQSSASTPGNKPAITAANDITPRQVKLSITLAFKTNGDTLKLGAVLPGVGAPTDAIVDVGGNVQMFTLTKGKSPKDKQKTLSIGKEKLTMKLNKITLAPDFADEGLTNGTFSGEVVNIQVSIISGGKLYEANLSKEYSAKSGKGAVK